MWTLLESVTWAAWLTVMYKENMTTKSCHLYLWDMNQLFISSWKRTDFGELNSQFQLYCVPVD